MANYVTLLGGHQCAVLGAGSPRHHRARPSADAVTFPWGSLVLFGIDKVTKYDMDAPLYVTTFAFVMNKDKYNQMSDLQKKAIDKTTAIREAAGRGRRGPGASSKTPGLEKVKAEPSHESLQADPGADGAVEEGIRAADQDLGRECQEKPARTRTAGRWPNFAPRSPNTNALAQQ